MSVAEIAKIGLFPCGPVRDIGLSQLYGTVRTIFVAGCRTLATRLDSMVHPRCRGDSPISSSDLYKTIQTPVKFLTPYRHFDRIERVLHHKIRI